MSYVGYLHSGYPKSLAEFGRPRELPRTGGWILERQIPDLPYRDAMGCYPLFCCQDWSQLKADFEDISGELVSLALVTDPFGDYDLPYLQRCFQDVVIPFKDHYIVDLNLPLTEIGGKRPRKHARRSLRKIDVEVCQKPGRLIDEWIALYSVLVEKHGIQGIKAFSKKAFYKQLNIPGMIVLKAVYESITAGVQLYLVQGDVVHCHLGAFNELGYTHGASYALDWFSIEYFAEKARWLNLGGSAGISSDGRDGLTQYKKGWATETRTTYFCGRIFNHKRYMEIVKTKDILHSDYFPAYRKGEFG